MAKILLDRELLDITKRVIENQEIDDTDQHIVFMDGLARLICEHFGGQVGAVHSPLLDEPVNEVDASRWAVAIHFDDNVPDGGGIYKEFDTDVSIEEWMET